MKNDDEITIWINQLAEQPETSMEMIWRNYYDKLLSVARRRMRDMPRRHMDEEDVVVDAMNSLFQGVQAGRFPDLNDRNDLWKVLLTITARKAAKAIRANKTQKRGGGQLRGESVFQNPNNDGEAPGIGNVLGNEPTPELAEDIIKQCEELLEQLDDPVLVKIAVLKLEGFSHQEISDELGIAVRSVERKVRLIRNLWSNDEIE